MASVLFTGAACSAAGPAASKDHELVLAINAAPPTFDPSALDEGASQNVWSGLYDTLLTVDENGALAPNAASAFTYSEDKRTLTLTIQSGMTFSNGDAVDAEAVAATLNRTKRTPGPNQGKLSSVTSIEATGKDTVVLRLSEPDATLLPDFTLALGVIGDPKTFKSKDIALTPVGSGPYTLDTTETVTGSTYVLNRRDDYWNPKAFPFKKVRIRVMDDPTAIYSALRAGELNVGDIGVDQVDAVKAAGFRTTFNPLVAVGELLFLDRAGTVQPELRDVRVRRAINMAFDRQQYVTKLLKGTGEANDQIVGKGTPAYLDDLAGEYPYDPAAAKQLLAKAGYPDGFTVKMPSTVLSTAYEPSITQSLADIGITVKWKTVPAQEIVSSLYTKQYPMAFWMLGAGFVQRDLEGLFAPGGYMNVFNPSEPGLDALFKKAARASLKDTPAAYQDINRFLTENAYSAPIFSFGTYKATKDGVKFTATGNRTTLLNSLRAYAAEN
ncbi:ABC transporter substrate-binding protein [Streptomyces sp. NPDC004539]|uniref:ABC transporter substrate-binding protein n=1 Tax=Streptomyces sp. NPDC004539 TaxID=3154280 RepID=UPI0033AD4B2C